MWQNHKTNIKPVRHCIGDSNEMRIEQNSPHTICSTNNKNIYNYVYRYQKQTKRKRVRASVAAVFLIARQFLNFRIPDDEYLEPNWFKLSTSVSTSSI